MVPLKSSTIVVPKEYLQQCRQGSHSGILAGYVAKQSISICNVNHGIEQGVPISVKGA